MAFLLDPWSAERPQLGSEDSGDAEEQGAEVELLEALRAKPAEPIPAGFGDLYVVDGSRRLEARLLEERPDGLHFAGLGQFGVGAVRLGGEGKPAAELTGLRTERRLLLSGELSSWQEREFCLPAGPGGSGACTYLALPGAENQPEGASQKLQAEMLQAEMELAERLAEQSPGALILLDGPLRGQASQRRVLGYVKSQRTQYLRGAQAALLSELQPGERTPLMRLHYRYQASRLSWYVRLASPRPYQDPRSGLIRLEAFAPETGELAGWVRELASYGGTLLGKLASRPHQDQRAPQNLLPTGALERAIARRMGDARLIYRRIQRRLFQEAAS